jgi:hypothetical protein
MNGREKIYLWPKPWVMNAVLDTIELQKAKVLAESPDTVSYEVEMYGKRREFELTIRDLPRLRSAVSIKAADGTQAEAEAARQHALIENLMPIAK